jgi:hypothetical protein
MLGNSLPLSRIAPANIMAVQVTNVKPKHAYRRSGMSEFASEGCARTFWRPARERFPRMGFVVRDFGLLALKFMGRRGLKRT